MGMKREAVQEERQRNKEKGEMDMDATNGMFIQRCSKFFDLEEFK